jgi:hypothetical protein
MVTIYTTCFRILKLCVLPTEFTISLFQMIFTRTDNVSLNSFKPYDLCRRDLISVRYELKPYILFRRITSVKQYYMVMNPVGLGVKNMLARASSN